MTPRTLALTAGSSYLVIFFAAIFANFFMLESLINDPLATLQTHPLLIRLGIMAFLLTVICDIIVAWALFELYRSHPLTGLSTLFRITHAILMGAAVAALPPVLGATTADAILSQVDTFNTLWLIGLLFFGLHLILLGIIIGVPKAIAFLLGVAGFMYIVDTTAHFILPDYTTYASIFLALVAIPSVAGEISFAIWLLVRGGKHG